LSPCWSQSDGPPTNEAPAPIWGAFLCDNDGRITRDFGESLSARSLVDMIQPRNLANFVETICHRDAAPGWEIKIRYEGSARRLLLQGLLTLRGVLVFATLAPSVARKKRDESAVTVRETMPNRAGIPQTPALTKQQQETLSAAVHDFKNPISCIITSCEYLEGYSGENLEPEQLEVIRAIQASAGTLLRLSSNIARIFSQG
jgi:hypothetical protein